MLHSSSAVHMRLKYFIVACVAPATLAACGGATAPAPNPELQAARIKWESGRPAAYSITVDRLCECTLEMSGPVVVAVRDHAIESRTYVPSAYFVNPTPVSATYANLFPSVDGLFDLIDEAFRRRAASVDVTYDSTLGFPVTISIDYVTATADDEVRYRATNFQPR